MYRVKPSKPVAVFGAVFGLAIVVVGAISAHNSGPGIILFVVAGIAVVSFNLWAAFAKNGSTENIVGPSDANGTPRIPGYTVTRDDAPTGARR